MDQLMKQAQDQRKGGGAWAGAGATGGGALQGFGAGGVATTQTVSMSSHSPATYLAASSVSQ